MFEVDTQVLTLIGLEVRRQLKNNRTFETKMIQFLFSIINNLGESELVSYIVFAGDRCAGRYELT